MSRSWDSQGMRGSWLSWPQLPGWRAQPWWCFTGQNCPSLERAFRRLIEAPSGIRQETTLARQRSHLRLRRFVGLGIFQRFFSGLQHLIMNRLFHAAFRELLEV